MPMHFPARQPLGQLANYGSQPLFNHFPNQQVLVSVRAASINPIDYKKPAIPVISWGLGGKPTAQVGP